MSDYQVKLERKAKAEKLARAYLEEAERITSELEAMVPREPEPGDIVRWSGRYTTHGKTYDFVSVKAHGVWYTTGGTTPAGSWWTLVKTMRERKATFFEVVQHDTPTEIVQIA